MKFNLVRFGDYFELRKGFSYSGENLVEQSDIGFVTLNSFVPGGGYKTNSEKPIDGEIPEKFFLHDGDVCIATTEQDEGLLASGLVVDYSSNNYSSLVYSHHVAKLFPLKEGLDPRFVYNVLRVPDVRRRVAYGDAGGTVQELPYEAIYEQLIPCPPVQVQEAICSIVFDIDEKIRVNEQMIQTLEQMGTALFKNWFIDFMPVRNKASGKDNHGLLQEDLAIFPGNFEESELGEIPEGWLVQRVGEHYSRVKYRCEFKASDELPVGETPVIQQGDPMLAGYSTSTGTVVANQDEPVVVFGDHTCRMKLMAENFIALPNTVLLTSKSGNTFWSYYATKDLQKFESYRRHWMELEVRKVVVPPIQVQNLFGSVVSRFHVLASNLERQNRSLRKALDNLIPALVSGELEVPKELIVQNVS